MTDSLALPEAQSIERPSKTVSIGEYEILCQGLTETQYMQLMHEARMFTSSTVDKDRKMKGADRLFRVMLSLIVNPDDRDYVEDLMADGKFEITELARVLRDLYEAPAAPKTGPQQVRRGSRAAKR